MAFGSAVSRATGFARSLLLVAALGTTTKTSVAYNTANTLPNMVFELLLGGVLTSVLVPSLVRSSASPEVGIAYAQRLLTLVTAVLGLATVAAVLGAPFLSKVLVPPEQRSLTTFLATLLLPEMLFYGLAAVVSAILNVRGVFGPTAWAPVFNNIAVCLVILGYWFVPGPADPTPASISTAQVLTLGIGTTLGIAAQAAFLLVVLRRSGFSWRWRWRAADDAAQMADLRTSAKWAIGYVTISQVGVLAIQKSGSHSLTLTIFTNADLLFQIPFGVCVLSYLTALMPRLSAAAVTGSSREVVGHYVAMCRVAVWWLVPITCLFLVVGSDLGATLFGGAPFGRSQATLAGGVMIGKAIAACAFGLVPFALVMIQLRVFYALNDMRTPTLINAGMVFTKVALVSAASLASSLQAEWLNIAASCSYVVGALVGHAVLVRRIGRPSVRLLHLGRMVVVYTISSCAAAAVVCAVHAHYSPAWRTSATALASGTIAWVLIAALLIALGAQRERFKRENAASRQKSGRR